MNPDHVRAFMQRNREPVEAARRDYWAERYRQEGASATWRASQELLEHVRRVRPDFPTARDRERDFADHLELKRRLDRASDVLLRR